MRIAIAAAFGSVLVFVSVSQVSALGVQWSGNGHFYDVVTVPSGVSWDVANSDANSRGGYLATIGSEAENNFVHSLINNAAYWNGSSGPWLGGFQSPGASLPDANWNWVTGEPWDYANWDTAQPNDFGGNDENRLHFGWGVGKSSWNDTLSLDPNPNFVPIAYVVETIPEPTALALATFALLGMGYRRRGRA